jgi:hypothetical protein
MAIQEDLMRALMIAAGMALIAPVALAQAPRDLAYCERLYDLHDRYVVRLKPGGSPMRDGMADLAVDRCRNGRFADGIPVLETKLQQAKIPLPDR